MTVIDFAGYRRNHQTPRAATMSTCRSPETVRLRPISTIEAVAWCMARSQCLGYVDRRHLEIMADTQCKFSSTGGGLCLRQVKTLQKIIAKLQTEPPKPRRRRRPPGVRMAA